MLQAKSFAYAALDAISFDRGLRVAARNENAEPRAALGPWCGEEGVPGGAAPRPFAQQALEIGFARQTARRVQSEALVARG
jgi:hypothetical protein